MEMRLKITITHIHIQTRPNAAQRIHSNVHSGTDASNTHILECKCTHTDT